MKASVVVLTLLAASVVHAQVSLDYHVSRGAAVTVNNVPVIRASALQLYAPGWRRSYYSSHARPRPQVTRDDATRTITVRHATADGPDDVRFDATETFHFVSDTKIEVTLTGELASDVEARVEWAIGHLNAFAFYGAQYSDPLHDPGEIHSAPAKREQDATLIRGTNSIRFDTVLGIMTVTVTEGPPALTLLDGRKTPQSAWADEMPSLWLGFADLAIYPHEPFTLRATIEFTPKPAPATAAADVTETVSPTPVERAFVPQSPPVQIIPAPREVKWSQGRFRVGANTRCTTTSPEQERAVNVVRREVSERFGWDWSADAPKPVESIRFERLAKERFANPEEYEVRCTAQSLVVAAQSERGFFNAAQTLVQMFQIDADGVYLPACEMDDAPSLAFRGVHLFPGKGAMDFHRRLVERVLARHKINYVVLESSYTQWDADKNIWIDVSVPKAELQEYVRLLRENLIEPIPLVQSLGHMEWLFKNGQNLDLAENPQAPEKLKAYAVTEPRTYELMSKIYGEAVDVFHPRYFHIGHDEVTLFGDYPVRPEAKQFGATALFLKDVHFWQDYFKPRHIAPLMWGDMLLARDESSDAAANAKSPVEAKARRDGISRDTIIADWHYQVAKPDRYKSLKIFHDEGFRTIACAWSNPENIYNLAHAARMYGAWGTLQTTWAGYSITSHTATLNLDQFSAYVLAAQYAWSADSPEPSALPWRSADVYKRDMAAVQRELLAPRPGFQLDLSAFASLPFGEDFNPRVPDRIDGITFKSARGAVVLGGALLPDRSRSIQIKCDIAATELAFLQTCAFPAEPTQPIATIEIHFADGTTDKLSLVYGKQTHAWDDPAGATVVRWTNPHPDQRISAVSVSTEHPYASFALLGVTGLK